MTKLECIQNAYFKATGNRTTDMSLITTQMVFDAMDEWAKYANQYINDQFSEACQKLSDGRYYLMGVEADQITVEDSLEAFGFGRDGLGE